MRLQRYGGTQTWDGASTLTLPKQPHTRRLVWLSIVGSIDGGALPVSAKLIVIDGATEQARIYLAAGLLTDAVSFVTMFLFAEEVGNDCVLDVNANAMITCSLGRDAYVDAGTLLQVELSSAPQAAVKISWMFEDVD